MHGLGTCMPHLRAPGSYLIRRWTLLTPRQQRMLSKALAYPLQPWHNAPKTLGRAVLCFVAWTTLAPGDVGCSGCDTPCRTSARHAFRSYLARIAAMRAWIPFCSPLIHGMPRDTHMRHIKCASQTRPCFSGVIMPKMMGARLPELKSFI